MPFVVPLRTLLTLLLTVALICPTGMVWAGTAGTRENPLPLPSRIVAFGDSLTAGYRVSRDYTYPAQLQRRLREAGYAYEVINAGRSGDTTTSGLRRLSSILTSQPAIVILELGANDGLRGQSLSRMASNLSIIIQRLRHAGITVVLAGMQIPPKRRSNYAANFAGVFRQLAEYHRVPLIPFFLKDVALRTELNQADGLHPNAQGYRIVAQTVFDVLEPLLTETLHP